jgi:hypothetical protein
MPHYNVDMLIFQDKSFEIANIEKVLKNSSKTLEIGIRKNVLESISYQCKSIRI